MSTGSCRMVSTAATERPAGGAATAVVRSRVGETRRDPASITTPRPAGCPPGPTPTTAARATSASASTRCSMPTGVTGPSAVVITWTSRPSTHSRPVGVEVADVAGPVPARVAGAGRSVAHSRS